ncbi:type VI secretion system baseplate subunit TssG [Rhodovulum sp. DZ06]|uniref:type VI secretion system baseplate subunit TssG n=1 Tax=Rhodovulum sp. DZ06 TaxID=3425126 RepID=UPI003D32E3A5
MSGGADDDPFGLGGGGADRDGPGGSGSGQGGDQPLAPDPFAPAPGAGPDPFGGAPGEAPRTVVVGAPGAPDPFARPPGPAAEPEPAPVTRVPDAEGWYDAPPPPPEPDAPPPEELRQAMQDALAELAADPTGWEFTAAVRLIQAANQDKPRIGTSDRVAKDPVRFGHIPTLAFSPSELRHYQRRDPEDSGPMELLGFQFGLWGPNGAMPEFITEELLQRDDDGRRDDATPAFADIFHHRLISLLYAAWERAQIAVGRDRPGADPWEGWLGAVQGAHGADPRAWRGRDALPEELRRRLSGWFASGPKSAAGAAAVATEAVGAPVEALEFIGEWLPISPDQRARFAPPHEFGEEGGMRLGQDIVVGDRYYSLQTRIRLRTAPLGLAQYRDLLRSGALFPVLRDAMRAYLGLALAWELQPVLDVGEAPAPKLDGTVRLGWDCWLSSAPPMRDLDDLVLEGAFSGADRR